MLPSGKTKYITSSTVSKYLMNPSVADLEKKVKLYFLDGRKVNPKFITLFQMFMNLKIPDTDKHLIKAIIPIPSHPGKYQIIFRDINRNADDIRKI